MNIIPVKLEELEKPIILELGFAGENMCTGFSFACDSVFSEYPDAIPSMAVTPPKGSKYPVVVTRDGNNVLWNITDSDTAYMGSGEVQLIFTQNNVVKRSYTCRTRILKSILAEGTPPDPVQSWIDSANEMLAEIPETIDAAIDTAIAAAKASGEFKGDPGFSPVVTTAPITGGNSVKITDEQGEHSFNVLNGANGVVVLYATDIAMSSTDSATSINAAITAVNAKTGADIPVSGSDPTKIDAAIAAVNAKTGADIDVSGSDTTKIDSALAALDAKTGADIPVSGSDSTKINAALSSLTTAVNSNAASINGIEDAIAIVANNNTHAAISTGQFVYVKNHGSLSEGLYKATTNIAANAALSTSNLTADASGGLNALSGQLAKLQPARTLFKTFWNLETTFSFDLGFTPSASSGGNLLVMNGNCYLFTLIEISSNSLRARNMGETNVTNVSLSGSTITITTSARPWGSTAAALFTN